jgi:plasmid stabilization system protein ParE
VARDLESIADLIADFAGVDVALRKLAEIEACLTRLADTPHVGSIHDEVAPGLRAIPAARKGVVCFVVDDAAREVRVISITYAGAEWMRGVAERL